MADNSKTAHQTEKLRQLCRELPDYVFDFMVDMTPRTSILTRLNYAYDLRVFFRYLCDVNPGFGKPARDVTLDDIKTLKSRDLIYYLEYLDNYTSSGRSADGAQIERSNSNPGKKRKIVSVRSLFTFLHKHGYIQENVSALVEVPKIHQKEIIRLETDEREALIDSVEDGSTLTDREASYEHSQGLGIRDMAMITLLLGTGIRISECVGMDLNDVDFERKSFRITRKGGDVAVLYFSDEVAEPLKAYYDWRVEHGDPLPGHEQALFLSLQRKRVTARAVENRVKKYAMRVTPLKHITPHKLRSTYGTDLYRQTGDIYLVADVLGHKDVNVTRRHYADIGENRRRMASTVVKLRPEKQGEDPGTSE